MKIYKTTIIVVAIFLTVFFWVKIRRLKTEMRMRNTIIHVLMSFLKDKFETIEEMIVFIHDKLTPELIKVEDKEWHRIIESFERDSKKNGKKVMMFLAEKKKKEAENKTYSVEEFLSEYY